MTAALEVPADEHAEVTVIGVCVDSHRNYLRAATVVDASCFWWPRHRRLFEACGQMCHLDGPSLDIRDERIDLAAELAGVPARDVRTLMFDRSVRDDVTGSFARRVRLAEDARKVMQAFGEAFNRIGAGEPPADVIADMPLLAGSLAP